MLAAGALILAAVALAVVVGHHVAYFRGLRAPTFGAFLETAGWLILFLASLAAPSAFDPVTVRVELSVAAVGILCVLAGRWLRRRGVPNGQ